MQALKAQLWKTFFRSRIKTNSASRYYPAQKPNTFIYCTLNQVEHIYSRPQPEANLRWGAGGADAPSSGIRPPADPKGPPFDTF